MKRFITKIALIVPLLLLVTVSAPSISYATATASSCGSGSSSPKAQVLQGVGQTGDDCTGQGVTNVVQAVVSILSYVVGIVAVIMVIIGGYKYLTSGGDSNKVSSAKNTLIYALVGLAIAVLAQVIVHEVLNSTNKAITPTTTTTTVPPAT